MFAFLSETADALGLLGRDINVSKELIEFDVEELTAGITTTFLDDGDDFELVNTRLINGISSGFVPQDVVTTSSEQQAAAMEYVKTHTPTSKQKFLTLVGYAESSVVSDEVVDTIAEACVNQSSVDTIDRQHALAFSQKIDQPTVTTPDGTSLVSAIIYIDYYSVFV
jgi:hypothetical protein